MPHCLRVVIFALICQGVQAFMSFDGGATPASLDALQAEMHNVWSPAEFGLLGSMDKIGMTATSLLWGRSLQVCSAKLLLSLGLVTNAACTAAFGFLRHKGLMYVAKFLMGVSQSLQGVWATVWTTTAAPPEHKTAWLGLGAVSAGVGNGLGTAVAGFGTANGLPYSLAFQVQAGVLAAFWVFLLFLRPVWLALQLPKILLADEGSSSPAPTPPREEQDSPSSSLQLKELWRNKVYCWTCLAISMAMFEMSGIQFLWVRVFVEVWGLNKNSVTLVFLLVSGIGGGIGIVVGPRYIDRGGGYNYSPGVVKSLQALSRVSIIGAVAGLWGVGCLIGKLRSKDQGYWRMWGDHWLWMTWVSISLIWAARNACVPALCGISMETVPRRMRAFSSGIEMTLRNILGYAFGPLLPGLVMNIVGDSLELDAKARADVQLCAGLAFVLLANVLDYWLLRRALAAASSRLLSDQSQALAQLREAFKAEDIAALEQAVTFARRVNLHRRTDGEAVIGMANETVGAYHAFGPRSCSPSSLRCRTSKLFEGSKTWLASREELQQRVLELEREVHELREENISLKEALSAGGLHGPAAASSSSQVPL